MGDASVTTTDQLMMEFELCIGLIFKPLRHHLKNLNKNCGSSGSNLFLIWRSVLSVLEELLCDPHSSVSEPSTPEQRKAAMIPDNLKATMDSLASEHFQNAIQVLITNGVLSSEPQSPGDITALTWASVVRMGVISDGDLQAWKQKAANVECTDESEQ
jgi:hypothetical protein